MVKNLSFLDLSLKLKAYLQISLKNFKIGQYIWHLSNNTGLNCRCSRVKPGKITYIATKDRIYALKPTRRRVQSTLPNLNPNLP
jgi:hypothetical protein